MATRTPKTPTNEAKPAVTFSPEQLQGYINEALAKQRAEFLAAMAEQQAAKPANGKSDVSTKNELQTIRVFKKAGFKDIQPRVNVLTFNKWLELGRRPAEGSKSLKVANLRLFHISQTRPLSADELKQMKAAKDQPAATRKVKAATVTELHPQ